jgi:hypothetical protein
MRIPPSTISVPAGIGQKRTIVVERLRTLPNQMHLDGVRRGRFAHGAKDAQRRRGVEDDLDPAERTRLTQLRILERAGLISGLEVQPSWDVRINDRPFCTYTANFAYHCADRGRGIIEEVKAKGVSVDEARNELLRLKRKAAELTFGIEITEVSL